jgi:protein SMG7
LQEIVNMEKKLALLLKSRGSLDPAVRGIRVNLRDSYEALLLTSDPFAHAYAAEVEQALWGLHYRGIEEFRTKIHNLSASPNNNNRTDRRNLHKDSLLQVVNSFKDFLDESCGYFHGLIVKLRANYGLPRPFTGEEVEVHQVHRWFESLRGFLQSVIHIFGGSGKI